MQDIILYLLQLNWHALWQIPVIFLVGAVVAWQLEDKREGDRSFYRRAVWVLVIISPLITAFLTIVASVIGWGRLSWERLFIWYYISTWVLPRFQAAWNYIAAHVLPLSPSPFVLVTKETALGDNLVDLSMSCVYLIWAIGFLAYLVRGRFTLHRLVRAAGRYQFRQPGEKEAYRQVCLKLGMTPPALLERDWVASPLVVGILRPIILLPAPAFGRTKPISNLEEFKGVVAHELVHIKYWDNLILLLRDIVAWLFPLARFLLRSLKTDINLEREQELFCDATAVRIGSVAQEPMKAAIGKIALWVNKSKVEAQRKPVGFEVFLTKYGQSVVHRMNGIMELKDLGKLGLMGKISLSAIFLVGLLAVLPVMPAVASAITRPDGIIARAINGVPALPGTESTFEVSVEGNMVSLKLESNELSNLNLDTLWMLRSAPDTTTLPGGTQRVSDIDRSMQQDAVHSIQDSSTSRLRLEIPDTDRLKRQNTARLAPSRPTAQRTPRPTPEWTPLVPNIPRFEEGDPVPPILDRLTPPLTPQWPEFDRFRDQFLTPDIPFCDRDSLPWPWTLPDRSTPQRTLDRPTPRPTPGIELLIELLGEEKLPGWDGTDIELPIERPSEEKLPGWDRNRPSGPSLPWRPRHGQP